MEGFLVTVDVEKAFDSLDHKFLIVVLKKFEFGQNFILWIELILKNQESCVINGKHSNIKYDTLCNDYKDGGLKNVDIRKKNYKSSVFIDKKTI